MAIDLDTETIGWIEQVAQGRVVSAERHFAGASRAAWNIDVGTEGQAPRPLFLLRDKGKGGGSARDANVLRALAESPIPVPELVGFDEAAGRILLTRLPGRSDFPPMDDPSEREPTARHLMELTAALHRLDPSALEIPHLVLPQRASDCAQPAIDQARGALKALGDKADPFFAFALGWLQENLPQGMKADALVHSDMGPGNFLFEGGRVTGIVDWEVAHFGDAMEDLAAIAVRDMATPVGDLGKRLSEYEAAGGSDIDLARINYFRLLILVRNSLMIGLGLAHPGEGFDVIEMTLFQTLLARAATLTLCDQLGLTRPSLVEALPGDPEENSLLEASGSESPSDRQRADREALLVAIQNDMALAEQGSRSDAVGSRALKNAQRGQAALAHAAEVGPALARAEQLDLSATLDSGRNESLATLERRLSEVVSAESSQRPAERDALALYFARRLHRLANLRAPLMGDLYERWPQLLPTPAAWEAK